MGSNLSQLEYEALHAGSLLTYNSNNYFEGDSELFSRNFRTKTREDEFLSKLTINNSHYEVLDLYVAGLGKTREYSAKWGGTVVSGIEALSRDVFELPLADSVAKFLSRHELLVDILVQAQKMIKSRFPECRVQLGISDFQLFGDSHLFVTILVPDVIDVYLGLLDKLEDDLQDLITVGVRERMTFEVRQK